MSPKLQLLCPTVLRSSNCSPSVRSVVVWFQRDSVLWDSCNFGDGTDQRVQSLMLMMMVVVMMINLMFNALIYNSFTLMTCILDPSSPSFTFWHKTSFFFFPSICVAGETSNCKPPFQVWPCMLWIWWFCVKHVLYVNTYVTVAALSVP